MIGHRRATVAAALCVGLLAATIPATGDDVQPVPAASASPSASAAASLSPDPNPSASPPPSASGAATSPEPSTPTTPPAQSAAEAPAGEAAPVLTVKGDAGAPAGTYGYVAGTLTPAAGVPLHVERYSSGAWRRVTTGQSATDGTFRLRLNTGLTEVGVQTFRVVADLADQVIRSEKFSFRRTALVRVDSWVKTKVIRFASYVRGTAIGASSRTVTLQWRKGDAWRSVGTGTADASGAFRIALYKKVTPGSHTYRLRVSSKLGYAYSPTFTQTRIVGWKSSITKTTSSQVKYTFKTGCPVGASGLSTITMTHWNYDAKISTGIMIVRRDVATQVQAAFKAAFYKGFKVDRMSNPDVWLADDITMMAANNTSAFNCRKVTGNPYRVSPHSYGRAIDVNTYENPYRVGGRWYPSAKYGSYRPNIPGLLRSNSTLVKELKRRGFAWYSGWDWQHFQK